MYYFRDYDDVLESRSYEQTLRDRANESLEIVRESFDGPSSSVHFGHGSGNKEELSKNVHPRILTYEDDSGHFRQSEAAMKLRSMLSSQVQTPSGPSPKSQPRGPLPSPEDAMTLLKNQAVYTSHLEAESRYIKEEMAVLRMKLAEILEENKTLHNELKTTVIHEILKEGGEVVGMMDQAFAESYLNVMNRHDFKRWQVELGRLSKLHAAKTDRLESQLKQAKLDVEKLEQTVEDLKSQIRMQESIPTHENGFVGVNYFLSESEKNITLRTIEKLTRERDDLMDHVTSLQSQLQEMSHREEDAYQQMKKGIQLVEQSQLEQTEALVQKEQVNDELLRLRERFENHVRESQTLVRAERDTVRRENQTLIDDLNNKLKELGELYTLLQTKYEKEVRDKAGLSTEIAELKSQLRTCDREVTVTAESYRTETTNASLQRNSAMYETNRLRSALEKVTHDRDQEMSRTKIELDDLKQRLNKAERELVNSKEECIHMTSNVQALERELHLAKMARDTIERTRAEDLRVIRKRAQDREEEMKMKMEEADDKYNQQVHEMDTMLLKQNKLILKLREECKKQAMALEKAIKKHRVESGKLNQANAELVKRTERMTGRLEDLENQADQHARVHDKMRERLKELDERGQNQSVQLVESLTKYSQICRDRQLLAREVEFLRTQLQRANFNSAEVVRLNSSSKTLVDDILNTMTKDERNGTIALIPDLQLNLQADGVAYANADLQGSGDVPEKISIDDLVSTNHKESLSTSVEEEEEGEEGLS